MGLNSGPAPVPQQASGHGSLMTPSSWLLRWAHLIPAAGRVLDVACGSGRHIRWLAQQGFKPVGVDRDAQALDGLHGLAELVLADIEGGPWPFPQRQFDAVLVTHYLWRPLLPVLVSSLSPGGVLIYETFAQGNESVGKPSRPDFLLKPGELLRAASGLRIVAYEDGFLDRPARFIQRMVAVNEVASLSAQPVRHALDGVSAR